MYKPKLNNDQRMFALRLFAESWSYSDIVKEIKVRFDISIHWTSIKETCHAEKHEDIVKDFRALYLAQVKAVPIANKRVRVDHIEKEKNRIIKMIEALPTTKMRNTDKHMYLSLVGELRRLLGEAREEMEKKPHLIQSYAVSYSGMSDEELISKRDDLIRRFKKATGRGLAEAGTDAGGVGSEDSAQPA